MPTPPFDDDNQLADLRRQMLKFAVLQLGDKHIADDVVQDAFVAALKNVDSFSGKALLRTWVFAILKHKIADALRRRGSATQSLDEEDEGVDAFFDKNGHWLEKSRPLAWNNPESSIHSQEFWEVFNLCLEHLPARQARVFMMREFIELESAEIHASTNLSLGNINVILHRARLRLRHCLQNKWFMEQRAC